MKLVIEDVAGTRSIVPFASDELVIGRAHDGVAWRLPDRNVSRRHARFVRTNGVLWIEDLESLTGTRVNGERIQGRRRLREGDLVEIGDYDLAVLSDPAVATGPATPPPIRATPRPTDGSAAPAGGARANDVPPPAAAAPSRSELRSPARPEPGHTAGGDSASLAPPAARAGEDRSRVLVSMTAAVVSALLGLGAGYVFGWLGLP
jgi:pSer/pThr/pTyr-binding forkhead associated (FHA) protein